MPLKPEDAQKITLWINQHVPDMCCPVCQSPQPEVPASDVIAALEVLRGMEGIYQSSSSVPVVPLVCTNCGYILLFSAAMMGLQP